MGIFQDGQDGHARSELGGFTRQEHRKPSISTIVPLIPGSSVPSRRDPWRLGEKFRHNWASPSGRCFVTLDPRAETPRSRARRRRIMNQVQACPCHYWIPFAEFTPARLMPVKPAGSQKSCYARKESRSACVNELQMRPATIRPRCLDQVVICELFADARVRQRIW